MTATAEQAAPGAPVTLLPETGKAPEVTSAAEKLPGVSARLQYRRSVARETCAGVRPAGSALMSNWRSAV